MTEEDTMRYIPKHADDYGVSGRDDSFDSAFLFNDASDMVEVLAEDWSLSEDELFELDMVLVN
tara:strand:- start:409 stop:597 length:189 start_codon:yes stop_codon:yes gene_type:complete